MYFALEETKEEFLASASCFFLKEIYNISIDTNDLMSMTDAVSDVIISRLNDLTPLMEEFLSVVDIQDSISNPTGILKYIENYAESNGTIFKKKITTREGKEMDVFDRYEPNNPEEYVICITDHISLLEEERGLNKHQTISRFSADYGRKVVTKRYNYTFVMVQQQSAASEAKEYNNKGDLNYSKLEPSLADLADNKYTQRDAHLVFGLFAPERYEIDNYLGFNIHVMKDNYRCLSVLKNRDGRSNLKLNLYFDGVSCLFKQLPDVTRHMGETHIQNMPANTWYAKYKLNREFFNQQNLFSAR